MELNGIIILDHKFNYSMNLKYSINKSKETRVKEKRNEKEVALQNAEELLRGRQWVINIF